MVADDLGLEPRELERLRRGGCRLLGWARPGPVSEVVLGTVCRAGVQRGLRGLGGRPDLSPTPGVGLGERPCLARASVCPSVGGRGWAPCVRAEQLDL